MDQTRSLRRTAQAQVLGFVQRAIGSSAAAYGAIGIAFVLLTWLWGLAIVLVAAAIYGSPQMKWRSQAR